MARRKRKPLTKTKPKSDYAKENQESILSEVCPKARLKESTLPKTTKEAKEKEKTKTYKHKLYLEHRIKHLWVTDSNMKRAEYSTTLTTKHKKNKTNFRVGF